MRWSKVGRAGALLVLAIAVAAVFVLKHYESGDRDQPSPGRVVETVVAAGEPLPRLVDLGADKCVPCKLMAPILEELRSDYAGRFEVVFIDVWKDRDAAKPYGIRVIPTQIFFDARDEELFRHEGFFSRADILETWQTLGYAFPIVPGRTASAGPEILEVDTYPLRLETIPPSESPVAASPSAKVVAYYFHWTIRCQSCLTIEATSRQALASGFSEALSDGSLEWHVHNMEEPEYSHFMEEFDLSTASLVLAAMDGDRVTRWKVLENVWELVETPGDLESFVVKETRSFLVDLDRHHETGTAG
jgi:thioredoxin 1